MKKAIIGCGGFGREVKAILLDNDPNCVVEFFVDELYATEDFKPMSLLDVNECEVV
jgi:hypothetical protein